MPHNVVYEKTACPICLAPYDFGFDIDVGAKVHGSLQKGDSLPWFRLQAPPDGQWQAEGLGHCSSCRHYFFATVAFEGLTFAGIRDVRPDPDDPHLKGG